jgi:hypothetical protein
MSYQDQARRDQRARVAAIVNRDRSNDRDTSAMTDAEFASLLDQLALEDDQ